ncbi:MAG: hypothetical protein NTY98_08860 [Verrucomicrobia bacterium]|nr:hypothetical protein [Verrucomicrobiota bacterium]
MFGRVLVRGDAKGTARGLGLFGRKEMGDKSLIVLLVVFEEVFVEPLDGEGLFYFFQSEVLSFFSHFRQTSGCGPAGFMLP